MTWMRPVTEYSELTVDRESMQPKFHIIGEWRSETNWVALCDMKAHQYAHFQPGETAADPEDKCGRCAAMERKSRRK